jgi:hypothetical protein
MALIGLMGYFTCWDERLGWGLPEMKVAALIHDKIVIPFTPMKEVIRECLVEDGIPSKGVAGLVAGIDDLAPELHASDIDMAQLRMENTKGLFMDAAGRIRPGLRGEVERAFAQEQGISMYKIRKVKKNPSLDRGLRWGLGVDSIKIAMGAMASGYVWQKLIHYVDCHMLCFSRLEEQAARLAVLAPGLPRPKSLSAKSLCDLVSVLVPSARELSWEEVFQLRGEPAAKHFRDKIVQHAGEASAVSDLVADFFRAAKKLIPNVRTEIVKAVGTNLPVPPVNPVGLVTSAKSVADARNFHSEHPWVAFISMLDSKVGRSQKS